MLRILFYMSINYKSFNDAINVKLCCAKTVSDFTKLRVIKGPKSKFPRGAYPQTPLVCHMLCTRIHTCPPNNPCNLILPLLGQKAERNSGESYMDPIPYTVTTPNQLACFRLFAKKFWNWLHVFSFRSTFSFSPTVYLLCCFTL